MIRTCKFLIVFTVVLLGFSCRESHLTSINIYHTSGAGGMYYSRPEPVYDNQQAGGYGVLKSYYEKEYGKKILLDSGDWFSQTPEGAIGKGSVALSAMGKIGYDGTGISYTDLVIGWTALAQSIKSAQFPVISSNLKTSKGAPPAHVNKFIIKDVNGIKIGIFSLVVKTSLPGTQTRLGDVTITPDVDAALQTVDELKNKEVDTIILLADIGENEENYSERDLAEQVEGIDIILGSASPGKKLLWKNIILFI
ncbi:2'(,)3'-cyclic-nucleotide 2'-phosphodiesterase (5'-nucleotidase family) [Elusimicrobium simillimum]|uniref:hypothetical protein n=1 Tax=Elusimicrobium simillimum TaxID=3143438 RepID=UPI003C6F2546